MVSHISDWNVRIRRTALVYRVYQGEARESIFPMPPVVPNLRFGGTGGPGARVGSSHTEPEEVRLEV